MEPVTHMSSPAQMMWEIEDIVDVLENAEVNGKTAREFIPATRARYPGHQNLSTGDNDLETGGTNPRFEPEDQGGGGYRDSAWQSVLKKDTY